MPEQKDTLLEFPCPFPLKIMGLSSDALAQTVLAIVQRHGGCIQAQAAVGQGCTMVVDWPAEIAPFSGAACAYPASLRGQKHT